MGADSNSTYCDGQAAAEAKLQMHSCAVRFQHAQQFAYHPAVHFHWVGSGVDITPFLLVLLRVEEQSLYSASYEGTELCNDTAWLCNQDSPVLA